MAVESQAVLMKHIFFPPHAKSKQDTKKCESDSVLCNYCIDMEQLDVRITNLHRHHFDAVLDCGATKPLFYATEIARAWQHHL